ncbi:hypothetical protein GW7_01331 [Heterocephalus glaber]|uniref:Uncharacterized protein n=1 Tax=Heterocephalus glaber TaxID=10181 RepID=G5C1Z3_HETGA|nr:hypothetical protein GW7_01331 [Heterocephalus glaber]
MPQLPAQRMFLGQRATAASAEEVSCAGATSTHTTPHPCRNEKTHKQASEPDFQITYSNPKRKRDGTLILNHLDSLN